MGKIPDLKRLTKEDFPAKYNDLMDKLMFVLNSHMEQVRNLFSKQIDFQNLAQELTPLTFTTNSDGQPINQLVFKTKLVAKVQGIIPVSVRITSRNEAVATMPVINFTQNSDLITIPFIGGLQPETKYSILCWVI